MELNFTARSHRGQLLRSVIRKLSFPTSTPFNSSARISCGRLTRSTVEINAAACEEPPRVIKFSKMRLMYSQLSQNYRLLLAIVILISILRFHILRTFSSPPLDHLLKTLNIFMFVVLLTTIPQIKLINQLINQNNDNFRSLIINLTRRKLESCFFPMHFDSFTKDQESGGGKEIVISYRRETQGTRRSSGSLHAASVNGSVLRLYAKEGAP